MNRQERESLDRWLTRTREEAEWSYMKDTEIHEWGMAFVEQVDSTVQKPGNESLKAQWMYGEWSNDIVRLCRDIEPDITDEQLEWVEQFISEI